MKKQTIHHSASGNNAYLVECYFRANTQTWSFCLGDKSVTMSPPDYQRLCAYYKGDLELWKKEQALCLALGLLEAHALQECNYLASQKGHYDSHKFTYIENHKKSTARPLVGRLFYKYLLTPEDRACMYVFTISWNCDAYYTKSK